MRLTACPGPNDSDEAVVRDAIRAGNATGRKVSLPLSGIGSIGVFEIAPPNFSEDPAVVQQLTNEWQRARLRASRPLRCTPNPAIPSALCSKKLDEAKELPSMEEGIVQVLLGLDCKEVGAATGDGGNFTVTRADLLAILRAKPSDAFMARMEAEPGGQEDCTYLVVPDEVEIPVNVFLVLASRVAQQTKKLVRIPLGPYGFRVSPDDPPETTISEYHMAAYDYAHG